MSQVSRLVAAMLALSFPLAALAQTASTPPASEQKAEAAAPPAEKAPEKKAEGVTVKPYGFVLGSFHMNTETFTTRDYPGQVAATDVGGSFLGNARQSRFGVRLGVAEENWTGAALTGVIEFDFQGGHFATNSTGWYNGIMRLRLAAATATWKLPTGSFAVLVGQDYGLVNPLFGTSLAWVASPIFWQSGNLWRRSPQVRATYTGNYGTFGVSLAAAVLSPQDANTNTNGAPPIVPGQAVDFGAGNASRRPDVEARLAFSVKPSKDINATLGVGYHLGNRRFQNPDEDVTTNLLGVDFEANVPYANLRGEWYMGEGTDDTYAGIFSPGVSNGLDAGGEHVAVQSDGFWAQAVLKPLDKVWLTVGYGMGSSDEDDLVDGGFGFGTRIENTQLTGGVIVNAGKAWKFGLEAMKVETTYLGTSATDPTDNDKDAIQIAFSSQLIF
jgi:hypothetical protein